MRYYQISSGSGPSECELAVFKFLQYLSRNYPNLELIQATAGYEKNTYKSVYIATEADLSHFTGPLQWICKSPYRPHHGRKNWFFSLREFNEEKLKGFDESQISFQTMRAGGHGGQNVNKVETAVRATYLPTGFSTVSQDERSQLANKKRAVERLKIRYLEDAEAKLADGRKKNGANTTILSAATLSPVSRAKNSRSYECLSNSGFSCHDPLRALILKEPYLTRSATGPVFNLRPETDSYGGSLAMCMRKTSPSGASGCSSRFSGALLQSVPPVCEALCRDLLP